MAGSTILLLIGVFSSVISINDINWDKKGTLIRCKDCGEIPWMPWQCLAGYQCEVNSDSLLCQEYSHFSEAGKIYLIFSIISIILIIFVLDICFSYLAYNGYGHFNLLCGCLTISVIFQGTGSINWILKTGVKVGLLCTGYGCEGNGGFFALLSSLLLTLGTIGFFISAPKLGELKNEDLDQEEYYNDPLAICNTPVSSYIEEEYNNEPVSTSFQLIRRKLSSIDESDLARSTLY